MTINKKLDEIEAAILDAQDICHLHKHPYQSQKCLEALTTLSELREEMGWQAIEVKKAKDLLDKWCDYGALTEQAQDKYHPTLRQKTMEFLYPQPPTTEEE